MPQPTTPTQQRIEPLDVFRGFAIYGIFVVNIVIMNSTFLNQDEFAKQWTSGIDQLAERILQLFFYTKFFPIFSLLFGLGIAMQTINRSEKGNPDRWFLPRRMFLLFIFGLLHIVLFWSGDVVHLYALLGFPLVCFIKCSNKTLLLLSLGLLLFPFYDQLLQQLFSLLQFHPEVILKDQTGATVHHIITQGSYFEGMVLRLKEYVFNIPMLYGFLAPIAMAMFLLGVYLGKNKIYNTLHEFIDRIKKPAIALAVISNVYRLFFLFVLTDTAMYRTAMLRTLFIKVMVVSDVIMGLFYLWLLGWLWYNTTWKKILSPLKYAGRMALTHYIGQSVIGLFLFSSVGLGLYESFSPSKTLLLATLVFALQVIFSKIWLSYFKYGPLEWIWRCLSYQKVFALKKER
ncbi:DUF418 domain-containing protein [Robertkochia sediminum]|uniref:DUF418 domain-containing protein n=1 Tax=Robertkochia sediminum TaxID=2785326 RepID=UPI001F1C6A5B|nr:DUF418 domain-containing protein [Robertkochia sediminum]MBL7472577.1 DUF418 domain-containing protein [Robertkochia sediminum]